MKELGQGPHHGFERNQSHSIRRERPKEAWHEAPPVPSPPTLAPYGDRSVLPAAELSLAVIQRTTHGIGHDSLLHDIGRVRSEPEALSGDTTGPEIDRRGGQLGVLFEVASQDVIGAPPEEEKRAEEDCRPEAAVEAADAVRANLSMLVGGCICNVVIGTHHLAQAVDRPAVHALRFVGGVLHLQTCLDVLDGGCDEADRCTGHDTCNAMSEARESCEVWLVAREGEVRAEVRFREDILE